MSSSTTQRPTHGQCTDGGSKSQAREASAEAQLVLNARSRVIQTPGSVRRMPIGLPTEARQKNADALNLLLADTITLYSLYKKSHWQVTGHTFYQLHLLFDKHAEEQEKLIDLIAERIQLLGGVAVGMPADVAEATTIERAPAGVEEVPAILDRLLSAHEVILIKARKFAKQADENDDLATNDLLSSEVIPVNELQVWFTGEHTVASPAVAADADASAKASGKTTR